MNEIVLERASKITLGSASLIILLGVGLAIPLIGASTLIGAPTGQAAGPVIRPMGASDSSTAFAYSSSRKPFSYSRPAPAFLPATDLNIAAYAHWVVVRDFNKDGNLDLAAQTISSTNVSVVFGDGTGGFGTPTNFPVSGRSPYAAAAGDFNRDGNLDLVTANYSSNNISVLLGDGAGGLGPPSSFAADSAPYAVVVADFNRDGNLDIAVANSDRGDILLLLGDGKGGFGAPTTFWVNSRPSFMIVGDFNRDGDPDLVTANAISDNVSVFLGDGIGGFCTATTYTAGSLPFSVATGDFNRDGILDLVTGNFGSNSASVLLGDGRGGFGGPTNFSIGVEPRSVNVADFNRDGFLDIALANDRSNNVSALLGNGAGGFGTATNFSVGSRPYASAVGDFNRDGSPDLAVANLGSGTISLLLNSCVPTEPTGTPNTTITPATAVPTATETPLSSPTLCPLHFSDVPPGSTFYAYIRCLACRGIVGGYPCGGAGEPCNSAQEPYFRPNASMTRGQIAKIVAFSACCNEDPGGQAFEDVAPGSPYYAYINRLANKRYIGGYSCGQLPQEPCIPPANRPYFRQNKVASRAELAKIVSNAAGFDSDPGNQLFEDVPRGSLFYLWIERLATHVYIGGYPCGGPGERCGPDNLPYFRLGSPITRGQASKIDVSAFFPNCGLLVGR